MGCESLSTGQRTGAGSSELPGLSEAGDDGDTGLGDRPPLLQLPEHPPEQRLVVVQILVDAVTGVAGARLGAVQLVELDPAGDRQLLLTIRQSDSTDSTTLYSLVYTPHYDQLLPAYHRTVAVVVAVVAPVGGRSKIHLQRSIDCECWGTLPEFKLSDKKYNQASLVWSLFSKSNIHCYKETAGCQPSSI